MRLPHLVALALQVAVIVEGKVRWTLAKSCHEGKPDRAREMIATVQESKRWAELALTKINMQDPDTKPAFDALMGTSEDDRKEIIDSLKLMVDNLDENVVRFKVGEDYFYEDSEGWRNLAQTDEHWKNFIITCAPDIALNVPEPMDLDDPNAVRKTSTWDYTRLRFLTVTPHDLEIWKRDMETPGLTWDTLPKDVIHTKALTEADKVLPDTPKGDKSRLRIPQAMYFNPLWINHHETRASGWGGWTQALFDTVTAEDAWDKYRDTSRERNTVVRPIDGLINASFTATMLHELFHVVGLGNKEDSNNGAYGWYFNEKNQSPRNADLYAILGGVVELANRQGGDKLLVDAEGRVTKKVG